MKKIALSILTLSIMFSSFSHVKQADAATINACPNGNVPNCLQEAVNSSHDGDTIVINAGTYSGPESTPFSDTNTKVTCFLNLGSRKLTLIGNGQTVLFGEGHDKPDVYANRAGICSNGGDVTIDNIHIKEFQGGGLYFMDSRLIVKNSILDGNDSGSTHLFNTSVLAANNFFVSNIGLEINGSAPIKAYNNTFDGKGLDAQCNQDLPPIDFINNIVVDDEETIGAGWIYGNCPDTIAQFKDKNIKYDLIWKNNHECYANREYCDNFTGKINADPQFIAPVADQRGIAAWANFGLKPTSPALGAGDPGIPGTHDIGAGGGPCATATSATCDQFITAHTPTVPEPLQPPPVQNNNQNNVNTNASSNDILGIPLPTLDLGNIITFPGNNTIPNNFAINTKQTNDGVMNLMTYALIAIAYIMVMHLAINMGSEFSLGLMILFFILGAAIGGWLHSYESGFVGAAILSLMFIGGPKKEM